MSFTNLSTCQNELLQCKQQLSEMTTSLVMALFKIMKMQDSYTAQHSYRVGLLCKAIAEEMNWSEYRCQQMYYVGLLHDFGKIIVPPGILHKEGRLTDEELTQVKKHAEYTYDSLIDMPFDFPLAEIVSQHHERIDGSGYPNGLTADQIYDEAKILIVADVIEAMANRRSYRSGLGLEVALFEIKDGIGKIYDEAVCVAVCRLFDEKNYLLPSENISI